MTRGDRGIRRYPRGSGFGRILGCSKQACRDGVWRFHSGGSDREYLEQNRNCGLEWPQTLRHAGCFWLEIGDHNCLGGLDLHARALKASLLGLLTGCGGGSDGTARRRTSLPG